MQARAERSDRFMTSSFEKVGMRRMGGAPGIEFSRGGEPMETSVAASAANLRRHLQKAAPTLRAPVVILLRKMSAASNAQPPFDQPTNLARCEPHVPPLARLRKRFREGGRDPWADAHG